MPVLDKALRGAGAPHWAGTVQGVIRATAEAKRAFTVEDIAERARRALEIAVCRDTTAMRTHVDADPTLGLKAMEAILPLRGAPPGPSICKICVFPQEGLFTEPETKAHARGAGHGRPFHRDTFDEARDLSIGHVAALTVKQGWRGASAPAT